MFATPSEAAAETKYKVRITSSPSGATVYINSRESKAVGTTPLNYRLPSGNHTVILELDDHEQLVDSIYVKRKRWSKQSFKLKLKEIEYGFVDVRAVNKGARGANILIDGKKSGIVPRTIKMSPGAHQVEVVKKGYARFEKWMEIEASAKTRLAVKLSRNDGSVDEDPDPKVEDKPKTKPGVSKSAPVPAGATMLHATAGVEVGWRKLRYRNAQTTNLRPFDADNVGMLNVQASLYPLVRGSNEHMRQLAFIGELAIAAPLETSTLNGTESIETTWLEIDVGLRYGIPLGGAVSFAVDVAYGATQFGFTNAGALMDAVPEVDYRYMRLSGQLVYEKDALRASIGGAWLPVLSTGLLADRFSGVASAGLKVRAGTSYAITRNLAADASAFYRRYAHNFSYDSGAMFQADGADDHFFGLTLGLTLRAF